MTISKMMQMLQHCQAIYGDLPVLVSCQGYSLRDIFCDEYEIKQIICEVADTHTISNGRKDRKRPDRILIEVEKKEIFAWKKKETKMPQPLGILRKI